MSFYCTITDLDHQLAQALTSATNASSQARRNLNQIGRVRDKNQIPDEIAEDFIRSAGNEIDSTLSGLYKVPFGEIADFEGKLFADITEYNFYIVLEKTSPLAKGDTVNLVTRDGTATERHVINEVIGNSVFSTIDPILFPFTVGSRILRVKYPDPIPWIAVRLACGNLFDKYFSAQVEPNISEYGKSLREQARSKLNDVLNGRAILDAKRTGRRLYDPNIDDQYGLPMGNDGSRDLDKLG
jgi:hypothetical protein